MCPELPVSVIPLVMLLDTGAPGMQISCALAEEPCIPADEDGKLSIMVSGVGCTDPPLLTILNDISMGQAMSSFIPIIISRPISQVLKILLERIVWPNTLFR
jgi:hypothetical protein